MRTLVLAITGALGLFACATHSNLEPPIPPSTMSDLILIQEIQKTDIRLSQLGVSAQWLALTRPAPTYTLTGTSFYSGTFWQYGSHGAFTIHGQAMYKLTPDYWTQFGYAMTQLGIAARADQLIRYRSELLNEALRRIARREAASRLTVESFYRIHDDLRGHEALVASIAPWVQIEHPGLGESALLNAIAERARGSLQKQYNDLGGDWYGLVAEEVTYPNGTVTPLWRFAKGRIVQTDNRVVGVGTLIDGQELILEARTDRPGSLSGGVFNSTFQLPFDVTGTATERLLTLDFETETDDQRIVGRAVMIR